MKTVEINVTEIRPYEKNNKKHPQSQVEDIAESIRQFGFKQPIVVDKDKVIIIGHGRFEAAKMLGLKTVPCVVADDLTDEQVRKLRIVDNKTNESEWDFDALKFELTDLEFKEYNFEFPDFNDDEVELETEVGELNDSKVREKEIECPYCGEKILI